MSKKVLVNLVDTLMAWAGEFHVQSGDRDSVFYLSVPDDWAALPNAQLQEKVFGVMQANYDALNAHFRAVEPDDLGYLAPLRVSVRLLTDVEEATKPWLQAENPAIWESTPCIVVDEDGTFRKVERTEF